MSEAALVLEVQEELARRGFRCLREVSFLLPTWDGGDQKRRLDLYAHAPPSWEHYRTWTVMGVEAKRRDGGELSAEIDGLFQARSVMFGRDFRLNGTDYVRPSVALYVDAESWTPENVAHTERETMLAERILWREGGAILRRDYRGQPYFIFAGTGRPQQTYRFPERT